MQLLEANAEDQIISSSSMPQLGKNKSINGTILKISKVLNLETFQVELDMGQYSKYEFSGLAKYVKAPKMVKF
jgi:hypothetical protein